MLYRLLTAFLFLAFLFVGDARAIFKRPILRTHAVRATGWSPQVLLSGAEQAQVKNTHILRRPNRPFHFYGNTVRRIYYRRAARR